MVYSIKFQMVFHLSIVGFKGGSGKSLIAFFLAKELSQRSRVLLIDKTFSGTVSSIFGIKESVFSSQSKYEKMLGNLTVLNATYPFNKSRLMEVYKNYIPANDIIIVDNPAFPADPHMLDEMDAYYAISKQFQYNILLIVSQGELSVSPNLDYLINLENHLKDLISNSLGIVMPESFKLVTVRAIVFNKVDEKAQLPQWVYERFPNVPKIRLPLLTLPFRLKGIEDYPTPLQLKGLAEYVEGLTYERAGSSHI